MVPLTDRAGLSPAQRAALERELAFADAYLTWNDEAQDFEDELLAIHRDADGDFDSVRDRLDEVQARIDVASLNSEEWNVLYRLRLQVEADAAARAADGPGKKRRARRRTATAGKAT